jgi:hypothetical protein
VLLVLVVLLSLAGAGSASAAGLRDLGRARAVTAGGDRYAVVARVGGRRPLVLDDSSATRRVLRGVPAGCGNLWLHGPRLLVTCPPAEGVANSSWREPRAWDVRERAPIELAGVERVFELWSQEDVRGGLVRWGPRGARRVAFAWDGYHTQMFGMLDWRAGKLVFGPFDGPRAVADVDRGSSQRGLCDPLTRTVDPRYSDSPDAEFLPISYGHGWAVQVDDRADLVLLRCGQRRPARVLAPAPAVSAFAGRTVAWVRDGRLRALHLGGRERSWRLPGDFASELAVTRAHVYALSRGHVWRGDIALPLPREAAPPHSTRVVAGQQCPRRDRGELVSAGPGLRRRLVPRGPSSVSLCRYSARYGRRVPVAGRLLRKRSYGAGVAKLLTRAFDRLQPPREGAVSCPNDDGSALLALFAYPHRLPVAVTISLSGCPSARNGVVVAEPTASLIARLERLVS